MRKLLLIVLMLNAGQIFAQGILFKNEEFSHIQKMAKEEHKLIFIDFHTSWCAPCKMMARDVFTKKNVGLFFNENFISCKLDAENEGKILADKYMVKAYPTMVFLKPSGELVHKIIGSEDAGGLISEGRYALQEAHDKLSLTYLKTEYEKGKNDASFLALYINKMAKSGERPVEAIEKYLSVQSVMKENEVEMMEFLLKNSKSLVVGGESERIFKANYDEYIAIATKTEKRLLQGLLRKMVYYTKGYAIVNKNDELYKAFLHTWSLLPEKDKIGNYSELYLNLLLIQGKNEEYKEKAVHYVDSVVNSKSLNEIRKEDALHYEAYCKKNGTESFSMFSKVSRKVHKNLIASTNKRIIYDACMQLSKLSPTKKEFEHMLLWTKFGKKLFENDYKMINLQTNILYLKGDKKKAVKLKKELIDSISKKNLKRNIYIKELDVMKNNGTIEM